MCKPEHIDLTRIDTERKHLEGLLKDRINFHLVFSSVFIVGLSRIEESMRVWSLIGGTLVSLLIGLAIFRSHRLVKKALEEIILYDPDHPYVRYRKSIHFPPNANNLLLGVPFILTALFATMTLWLIFRIP